MQTDYRSFLDSKRIFKPDTGFEVDQSQINTLLKPWQKDIVRYMLRRGATACFADCGLGKTFVQLEWAYHVAKQTKGLALILSPLAVSYQTLREAEKFNICRGQMPIMVAKSQLDISFTNGIVISNYEKLSKFSCDKFTGIVLDESSLLKNYNGKTKAALCESFANTPYKLACTATPAPNDLLEIGNHSEFLGVLPSREMISRWFINDSMNAGKYRLKGHAADDFWDWVSSWAVSVSTPADLGYPDDGYILPELHVHEHEVDSEEATPAAGQLFNNESINATTIHKHKRNSIKQRAAKVREIIYGESSVTEVVPREQAQNRPRKAKGVPASVLPEESREIQKDARTAGKAQCCQAEEVPRRRAASKKAKRAVEELAEEESAKKEGSETQEIFTELGGVQSTDGPAGQEMQDLRLLGHVESELLSNGGSLPCNGNCAWDPLRELQLRDIPLQGQPGVAAECNQVSQEQWVVWCDTDYEQDEIESMLNPSDFVSIRGSDSEWQKVSREAEWRSGKRESC